MATNKTHAHCVTRKSTDRTLTTIFSDKLNVEPTFAYERHANHGSGCPRDRNFNCRGAKMMSERTGIKRAEFADAGRIGCSSRLHPEPRLATEESQGINTGQL